jgi:hypothetical protein
MSRPAIFKTFTLAGISEGWTDEHYIKYRPFNYVDLEELESIDEKSKDGIKKMRAIFADKFISGFWLVETDKGGTATEAMTPDDISYLDVEVTNRWLKEAMGKVDPKAPKS